MGNGGPVVIAQPQAWGVRNIGTGRNAPCPCGSGKKYKRCCLAKDQAASTMESVSPISPKMMDLADFFFPRRPERKVDPTQTDIRRLIDEGYSARAGGVDEACRLWWRAWTCLKPIIAQHGVTDIDQLEAMFPGKRPLGDWSRDMARELGKVKEPWVFTVRRRIFAAEFLRLLPESVARIREEMQTALTSAQNFLASADRMGEDFRRSLPRNPIRTDPDAWYETYQKGSPRKRYELLLALADGPERKEFVEELNLGELVMDAMGSLESGNLQEEAAELLGALRANWKEFYTREFEYLDPFLINRSLFLGEVGALPDLFKYFAANPDGGIDHLLPLFTSLVAYQHREVAVALAEEVFEVVKSSAKLISGAEEIFGEAIYTDRLERAYAERREGIDWEEVNRVVEPYDFEFQPKLARIIEELWSDRFSDKALRTQLAKDWWFGLAILGFDFYRTMHEHKDLNFAVSRWMWRNFTALLSRNTKRGGVEKSFEVSPEVLDELVADYMGGAFFGMSNKKADGVLLVWALPYIYDFLLARGLVDPKVHRRMAATVTWVKESLFEAIGNDLWEFAFVRRWKPADSVKDDFLAYEAAVFDHSFKRREPLTD